MNFGTRIKRAIQAFSGQWIDVLSGIGIPSLTNNERGELFTAYPTQVDEAWRRYYNRSQYGNLLVQTVINYWASWICGNGVNFKTKTSSEKKYLESFLKINPLDSTLIRTIIEVGMIEGGNLCRFVKKDGATCIRQITFHQYKYQILYNKQDAVIIDGAKYMDSNNNPQEIDTDDFAYIALSVVDPGTGYPRPPIAPILTPAINMDIAKADWRDMNHIWGSLGPHFETKDFADSERIRASLAARNETDTGWQFGDTSIAPAKLSFPEPSGAGQESIQKEITNNAKSASGYTGIGIHLMGWASEMSNRATAKELAEARVAFTSQYREAYQRYISNLVNRCYEKDMGIKGEIAAFLPEVSNASVEQLMEVWLPLRDAGAITQKTLVSKIPGIEPDKELKELEKEEEKKIEEPKIEVEE